MLMTLPFQPIWLEAVMTGRLSAALQAFSYISPSLFGEFASINVLLFIKVQSSPYCCTKYF